MDDVIMEETTDGEHKVQVGDVVDDKSIDGGQKAEVGEEEALMETMGSSIVKENTDAEPTTQVEEEAAVNRMVDSASVQGSTDVEHTARVGEKEAPKESTQVGEEAKVKESANRSQVVEEASREAAGNVMAIECKNGHKARNNEVVLNDMVGNDIDDGSTDGKQKMQVRGKETQSETVDSVIVKESTGGENKTQAGNGGVLKENTHGGYKAQVRRGEAANDTTGIAVAGECTAGDHPAHVEEEEVLNGTGDNVISEENANGKHKIGEMTEGEAFNETMDNIEEVKVLNEAADEVIVKRRTDSESKAAFRKEATLDETMGDTIVEGSTDGDLKGQTRKEASFNETMTQIGDEATDEIIDNSVVEESSEGKSKAKVRKVETSNKTAKQVMESKTSGTRTIPLAENDQYVSYHLPSLDKANFSMSDLVWGKVKSHPWWPGQIFDLSDATKLAMRYQKKDSFLIGYFGDKTFAWCDEAQLKPFHTYFSQLEKQCSSDTFAKAIHDILTEVARRIELGMACSCLPEEDYTNVKYQKVENAGIQGGNINSIIHRSTVANYFQPARLLEYIRTLAQFPSGRVERLGFLIAQSQLKAFYHSKGYPELPVYTVGGGVLERVPDNSPSNVKRTMENAAERRTPIPSDSISAKRKSRSKQRCFNKQDHDFVNDDKHKSISKMTTVRTDVHLENGGKSVLVAKAAGKPLSNSSGKKHTMVESDLVDSGRCKKRVLDSFEDTQLKSRTPTVTSSFKIGEFIRRAASQMTGGPLIVKCQADALQEHALQDEHKKDDIADFDIPDSPVGNQTTNLSFIEEDNSEEMFSQLGLAARNPMDEFSFAPTMVAFFTGFRDHCVSSSSEDKEMVEEHDDEHIEKCKRGRPRKVADQLVSSDIGGSENEKHVKKRRRSTLTNVISQLAFSDDITSEEEKPVEKPVEKRKRGRPRKNPRPAFSYSSEDKEPVLKPQTGLPGVRPKKVDTQLVCPDYSSSENKTPIEKHKKSRPREVNTEIAPSDMPMPDHVKDSCLSDMYLQQKKNGKGPIQYQRKRRKSKGELSLPLPTNPVQEIEQQLQLIAMNPNLKLTFIEERSIISVEDKIVDECMPTSLILSFNNANSLPSETDLIRIFSRYGPLKEAETDVLRKTNRAKVVFKRRVDAETAFSSAGKYSIFGPGLLSYQLKPWTPRSTLQGTLQGTQATASTLMAQGVEDTTSILMPRDSHDVTLIATPQENLDVVPIMTLPGNGDAAPVTTPQDDHDAAFISTSLDKCDLGSITTAQDHHDLTLARMMQDKDDAAIVVTPQEKCDTGQTIKSNLEVSERAEAVIVADDMQIEAENAESSPNDKQDPASITSLGDQDAVSLASPLVVCALALTSMQDDMDAAPITTGQDNRDAAGVITSKEKM